MSESLPADHASPSAATPDPPGQRVAGFRRRAAGAAARDPLAERRRLDQELEQAQAEVARVREARAALVRQIKTARDRTFAEQLKPLVRGFARYVGEDERAIESGLRRIGQTLGDPAGVARVLRALGLD